jgi:hypothetical protein
MSLFKYVPPERIDIIENGFVRFTQPCAFNDPFETFPCFTGGLPDDYIQDFLVNQKPDELEQEKMFKTSFETAMSKYPGLNIPYEAVKDLPIIKEALGQVHPLTTELFTQFMSGSGALFSQHTIKMALDAINKEFGVFCLAEKPDNLLMWAHYSASHTGLALEFDEKHQFFDRRTRPEEIGRHLKKVQYTRNRPQMIMFDPKIEGNAFRHAWAKNIFFSKSEHWAYEEEWRIVDYLRECPRVLRSEPHDIYLFPVPMGCLTGIIFGCKATDITKSTVKRLINANAACSHIRLSEASIDGKQYRLNFSAAE